MSKLIAPHGNVPLKPLLLPEADRGEELKRARTLKRVPMSSRQESDLLMLAMGAYTPLNGFMDEANWRKVLAVNLDSAFHAARHQVPALQRRGGGSIVFTSSFVGHTIGLPGMGAYAASKAGLIGLAQVLAVEHGPENIRVNALLPGGTMTAMAGDDAGFHEVVRGFHALKRLAEPAEIARAALFLLSDHGSFVTGSAMIADGGNSVTKA